MQQQRRSSGAGCSKETSRKDYVKEHSTFKAAKNKPTPPKDSEAQQVDPALEVLRQLLKLTKVARLS
jgi:hypothetical protein